jgi:hypothetical protein
LYFVTRKLSVSLCVFVRRFNRRPPERCFLGHTSPYSAPWPVSAVFTLASTTGCGAEVLVDSIAVV